MTTLTPTRTGPTLVERIASAKVPDDLSLYSAAVHGRNVEPYQLAWEHALNNATRTGIVCPPDTFKSTTVQDWVERAIGHNRNIRILWLMNAGEQAEKRVMTVASTIESNRVYRGAFPDVTPDKASQWTKSVLYVHRDIESEDPTLMGCGLNGPYQGLHFDVIIIDDPTNQEDVRSPTTMALQEEKIRGVIRDRLVDGGRFIFILTRWGDNDLVRVFKSMGFTIIEMPVISDKYPWGPTISPIRFPMPKIEELRRDKGEALFQMTFMCNPSAMSSRIIPMDHIRYWDRTNLPEHPLIMVMTVDPAITVKTMSDYSAIATMGIDPKTRVMYLLDMWADRVEAPDLEEEIVKRAKHVHGLRYIGVETIAYQLSIVQHLKRKHRLPLIELPYRSRRQAMNRVIGIDKDKRARAAHLDSLFISDRLFIPRDLPMLDGVSYEAEICSVPTGPHDDRMDVTAFGAGILEAISTDLPKVSIRAF